MTIQPERYTRPIIGTLVESIPARKYLEIGFGSGENFRQVPCDYKVSVDPGDGHGYTARRHEPTHRMTSDAYFSRFHECFDLIFIDGLHHWEQVYRDIVNSLERLNPGGYIVCHDLNPHTEIMQRVPCETRAWTGDCWKAWVRLRGERSDLEMVTLDSDYGHGLIRRGHQQTLDLGSLELTWENLVANRKSWLNLVPLSTLLGDFPTG